MPTMQKFTWLDDENETLFEAELAGLEEDQEFLETFSGVTMLLDAVTHAEGDEALEDGEFEAAFEDELLAS
jgi:hypothetical protein